MPIPIPLDGEARADFIDRCMGDEVMQEYETTQRRAICEVQADYVEEGKARKASAFRVCFYKSGKKTRKGYQVNVAEGSMQAVSLMQLGEARGHGIYIDGLSLGSALEVLGNSNLPAFITHNGALREDRMLKQVGYFSGFYLEQGKLKAEKFQSLESFRDDETESFNRLFDLAKEMPDAFGLSLVFDAELVWVFEEGEEKPIADSDGKGAVRDMPSVRFNAISSADFVDEPAANDDGLFSKKSKPLIIMDEETKETEEPIALASDPEEEKEEATEETTEEAGGEEVAAEESTEEAAEESAEEEPEEEGETELAALTDKVAALEAKLAELSEKLEASEAENAKLSKVLDGEEIALEAHPINEGKSEEIAQQFCSAEGAEATRIWKHNKQSILGALRSK